MEFVLIMSLAIKDLIPDRALKKIVNTSRTACTTTQLVIAAFNAGMPVILTTQTTASDYIHLCNLALLNLFTYIQYMNYNNSTNRQIQQPHRLITVLTLLMLVSVQTAHRKSKELQDLP